MLHRPTECLDALQETKVGLAIPPCSYSSLIQLFLAGVANHLHVCDFQMSVLGVTFLHATIFGCLFCVFFHVVHLGMRYDAGCGNGVTHVSGKWHFTAADFPGAPIVGSQKEFVSTVAF